MIRAPIATSLSTKNKRFSNIFSKIRIVPSRLGGERQRDRGEVGRERGPGAVLDLRDRVAQVVLHRELLAGRDEHVVAVDPGCRPSRPKCAADHRQVVRLGVADPQRAAGGGGERDEAGDLDVVGADRGARRRRACRGRARSSRSSRCRRSWRPSSRAGARGPGRAAPTPRCEIVVGPGVSAAAISAFSVPITDGSSMKTEHGFSPPSGALISIIAIALDLGAHVEERVEVRIEAAAADEVAAGRRHAGLAEASQQRPGEQEGGADPRRELLVGHVSAMASACRRSSLAAVHSALTPRRSRIAICASVSRIRGTFWSWISSSVSRQAARIGSAAFLLPAAAISPLSGSPPWITNFSVMGRARVKDAAVADPTRQEAWELVCEWVESDSLRKHLLGVEARWSPTHGSLATTRSAGR